MIIRIVIIYFVSLYEWYILGSRIVTFPSSRHFYDLCVAYSFFDSYRFCY